MHTTQAQKAKCEAGIVGNKSITGSFLNFGFFSDIYRSAGLMMISIFVLISISRSFWQLGQRIMNEAFELNAPFLKTMFVQW